VSEFEAGVGLKFSLDRCRGSAGFAPASHFISDRDLSDLKRCAHLNTSLQSGEAKPSVFTHKNATGFGG
jgi:hypothetical protein